MTKNKRNQGEPPQTWRGSKKLLGDLGLLLSLLTFTQYIIKCYYFFLIN